MQAAGRDSNLIRFERVCLTYPGSGSRPPIEVLRGLDFEVGAGEFVSIIGPSGCGKSTLLSMLAGYLPATSGAIRFDGDYVRGPGRERMMVFQHPALFPWLTASENVAYGLNLKANRTSRSHRDDTVATILKLVQLEQFAGYYPRELSGGMRQRVEIARALAINPKALLMDEPLGALDALTRRTMQREVLRIWEETKTTILFVTHDIDEAILMSDRIVVMASRPGHVREIAAVDVRRPRRREDPEVVRLARHLSDLLS